MPSPGRITGFHLPGGIGVRVDTWAYTDCVIPPYYDSLVAKLVAYGNDRPEAIARMRRALGMFIVEGIHTSIPLHQRILADPDFEAGRFDTNFVKRFMPPARTEPPALWRPPPIRQGRAGRSGPPVAARPFRGPNDAGKLLVNYRYSYASQVCSAHGGRPPAGRRG